MPAARARATKTKTVNGRTVSAKSKTGDPACSAAMSEWVLGRATGNVSPEVNKKLGECRAKSRALRQGAQHRAAGNEGKAQRLEALAAGRKGPITAKDRLAKAKEIRARRAPSSEAKAVARKRLSATDPAFRAAENRVKQLDGRQGRVMVYSQKLIHRHGMTNPVRAKADRAHEVGGAIAKKKLSIMANQDRRVRSEAQRAELTARRAAKQAPAAPARPSLREQAAAHRAKKGTAEERSRRLSDTAMSRVYKYDGMRGRNAATERNIGRLEALTEYRKSNNLVDPNVAARAAAAEKARAEQAPKPKPAKASKPKAKAATKAPSVTAPTSPPSAVQASVPPKSGGRGTPERLAKAARLKQWANNRRETLGRDRQTAAQAVQSGNPAVIRARILEMGRYAPRPAQDAGGGVILPGDSARRAAWKNRRSAEFQSAENRAIDVAYARRMSAVQPPPKPAAPARPSLREQAAAARLAKGTTAERLAAIKAKIKVKAAPLAEESRKAKAAYDRYQGDSPAKAAELRNKFERDIPAKARPLVNAAKRIKKIERVASDAAASSDHVRGSAFRVQLAKQIKILRPQVAAASKASSEHRLVPGAGGRKRYQDGVKSAQRGIALHKRSESLATTLDEQRRKAKAITAQTNRGRTADPAAPRPSLKEAAAVKARAEQAPKPKPAPAPRPKSFEVTLERIGQNNAHVRGGANAYVAAVKGPDPKYGMKREFLSGNRDYGNANSVKSRGVTETYSLPRGGVYEINEPRSWKNVDRYHVVARGTGLKKVDKERALAVSTRLERFKANRARRTAARS